MFIRRDPDPSDPDELWAVDSQCVNRDLPDDRETDQSREIIAPCKMVRPPVPMRMKECNLITIGFQASAHSIRFVSIAGWTCQAEILEFCLATVRQRHDVFQLECDD